MLGDAASVLTIHNIGYQGIFPPEHYDYVGLQWGNYTPDKLEDHGHIKKELISKVALPMRISSTP